MRRFILLPIILSFVFFSCSQRKEANIFGPVEAVMEEQPDSALTLLRAMPQMPSRRLAAKHALLHSRALDKCWIELTTDSIIAPAVEYYKSHGSVEEKIMADCYLGRIRFNAKDYEAALICQTRAKKLADKNNLLYWQAMTASDIGFILNATYDVVGELESMREAHKYWVEYGDSSHISKAVYSLATAYQNNGETDIADSLYAIVCDQGNYEAFLYRASNALKRKEPDVANGLRYYDEALSHGQRLSLNDGYLYALALSFSDKQEKAESMYEQLSKYPMNVHGYYSKYRIYRHGGKYEEAMLALAKYTEKSDSIVRVQLNQSVHKARSDYNELSARIAEEKKKNTQIWMIAILTTLLLLFAIVMMRVRIRRLSLEDENNRLTLLYHETSRMLEESRKQEVIFQKNSESKNLQTQAKLDKLRVSFAKMYQSQFTSISCILDKHTRALDDMEVAKDKYVERVNMILSEIRNSKKGGREFESMLDSELDGIMSKLRADYPDFKESDFRFLSYLIAGFDATARSIITGSSINNMRVVKSRLLKHIKERPTSNLELYHAFLFPDK